MDDRPVSDDKQINPDVIGHIFEKYINQKQMGAYYTKEDITEYIGKNTIIPYLFESAKKKCEIAFKSDSYIWQMLKDNPDKYIYDAVKKGCDKELTESIAKGVDDVSKREEWNAPASEEYALPTEIWRETVERRNRYFDIKSKLENGQISSINDFITYNLDIRQFAEDIITNAESPDVVKAFYYTIAGHIAEKSNEKDIPAMSILDPTCGSGAFLFAGLNILEPLYDACIDKMYAFKHEKPDSYKEFDSILEDIEKHPNREYFIYKSIILNNLYGVDIMKEATEIAKLRLFLKLASCAEVDYKKENFGLEALPDIDFNIRAGNSLVGFANYKEVEDAVKYSNVGEQRQCSLIFDDPMPKIDEKAQLVAQAYKRFRDSQTVTGTHDDIVAAKQDLQHRLSSLNDELNHYMAKEYGIDTNKEDRYKQWLSTHEPFNWFVEFYDVIHNRGGFDVVIGNPPYLEVNEIEYTVQNYQTIDSKAVHVYCIERSLNVLRKDGNISMIFPISLVSTQRMTSIQNMLSTNRKVWYSNFSWRPDKLFDQVNRALTIFIANFDENRSIFSTTYQKWYAHDREDLMKKIKYISLNSELKLDWIPKVSNQLEISILNKLCNIHNVLSSFYGPRSHNLIYYKSTGGLYWKVFTSFSPEYKCDGVVGHSSREKTIHLNSSNMVIPIIAILSSDIFWWYYCVSSNCRDLNPYDLNNFKIPNSVLEDDKLAIIGNKYIEDLKKNSVYKQRIQKNVGITEIQSFKISKSKSIIDEIDKVLAKHYGFTDEELDYIINYDIKYRMGDSLNGDEE